MRRTLAAVATVAAIGALVATSAGCAEPPTWNPPDEMVPQIAPGVTDAIACGHLGGIWLPPGATNTVPDYGGVDFTYHPGCIVGWEWSSASA